MSILDTNSNISDSNAHKYENKPSIWGYFSPSNMDKSKAICNQCLEVIGLGSDELKEHNLKLHLAVKHHNEFLKFLNTLEDAKVRMKRELERGNYQMKHFAFSCP